MGDYRATLNLPKTAFPMKANLPAREPEQLAEWARMQLAEQVRARRQGRPRFVLHDGPPYANGEIHIGHALNKILKHIIVRYRTMRGYDAPYWDCHGLPIEHNCSKSWASARMRSRATSSAARPAPTPRSTSGCSAPPSSGWGSSARGTRRT